MAFFIDTDCTLKAFFGEESQEGKQWAHDLCEKRLRNGDIDTAISIIETTGTDGIPHQEARRNLVNYIQTNRERMPYPKLEAAGYPRW